MKFYIIPLICLSFLIQSCSNIDTSRPHYIIGEGTDRVVLYADENICSATRLMNNPFHVRCILSDSSIVEYETNYFELVSPEDE